MHCGSILSINRQIKMAFYTVRNVQTDAIKKAGNVVLLHCITEHVHNIPMYNCPALGVQFRECHISIPEESGVRRFVLVPDRGYNNNGEYFSTPKLISVESSCIIDVSLTMFTFFVQKNLGHFCKECIA